MPGCCWFHLLRLGSSSDRSTCGSHLGFSVDMARQLFVGNVARERSLCALQAVQNNATLDIIAILVESGYPLSEQDPEYDRAKIFHVRHSESFLLQLSLTSCVGSCSSLMPSVDELLNPQIFKRFHLRPPECRTCLCVSIHVDTKVLLPLVEGFTNNGIVWQCMQWLHVYSW